MTRPTDAACAFCFKKAADVKVLIASPSGPFICEVCISACVDMLTQHVVVPLTNPPAKEPSNV